MLSISPTYVDDDWAITADTGTPGLSAGDTVSNLNDSISPGSIVAIFGTDAFDTINDAIANTSLGGTVQVLEGIYHEHVSVGTSLSIVGPNTGITPTGATPARVAEAVIDGDLTDAPFSVTADDVTIDGFTITDGANGANAGISLAASTSGVQVLNNIVSGNTIGIYANSDGPSTIQHNLFDGNNIPGPSGGAGIYSESSAGLIVDGNEFKNHSENNPILFAATGPLAHGGLQLTNNDLHDNYYGIYVLATTGGLIEGNSIETTAPGGATALALASGNSSIDVLHNVFNSARGLRVEDDGYGFGANSNIDVHFNSFAGTATYGLKVAAGGYSGGALDASRNWWGSVTGPSTAANPGGLGSAIDDTGNVVGFRPWLVYGDAASDVGFQVPSAFNVAAGNDVSAAENDYTLLANAIGALLDDQSMSLSGTFNWDQPNALAAWALGNDAVVSAADDYSILAPAGVNGVTLTAASLGAATIQGPGDLAAANLEGFLVFDGGDNKAWTISNLQIYDFDLGIAFFNGAGGTDAFDNTKIIGNHLRVATDLNATVAPADVNQNIGIHFSFGKNQEIGNNQIDFAGTGISDGANFATSVGMQSNTSGGDVYDGLSIHDNKLQVLGAQSASPEVILGIWENGHAHLSDVSVTDNSFTNLDAGNNPALNLQRAFRVTSHSSPTTTVTYSGNQVGGANLGMQWISGSDFKGNEAVEVLDNSFTNVAQGILLQSNGVAHLAGNVFDQTAPIAGSVGLDVGAGSLVTVGGSAPGEQNTFKGSLATYIRLSPGASPVSDNLDATGNLFGVTGAPAGIAPSTMTLAQLFELEDKLVHHVDVATVGFITVVPGNVYVTPNSFLAPFTTDARVQRGVDAASSGGTVHVAAGTYAGEVSLALKNNLSLLGAGMNASTLVGSHTNADPTLNFVNSTGSLVDGFTITRDGNNTTDWAGNVKNHGVAFGGGSNNTLQHVKLTGNRNGIILDNSFGNTIRNNVIDFNRTGMNIQDGANNNTITENFITNNWTFGVIFVNSVVTATGNTFFDNNISGNWYGQVEDQSISGGGVRDFSGNWLGTNAVTKTVVDTANPPYASLIPVAYGGSATPPGSAVVVGGSSSSKIDYSPWLDSGIDLDADPTNGFQGDFSTLHVDDDSAQAGAVRRIQEGVDLVSGSTVIVHNGLYLESNITLSEAITIDGESRAGVVVAPAAEDANDGSDNFAGVFQHAFLIQSSDVTIKDLTIDGEGNSGLTPGKNNYRAGIVTDYRLGEVFDNSTIDNVAVRHTYRRGIQLDSGTLADGKSLGNAITNSIVDDVTLSYAIALFESDGTVAGNQVTNSGGGIATNVVNTLANAPLVTIRANTISGVREGIHGSGLAAGSVIGGPLAADANHVTLPADANADIGIIVEYATGQVTVQRNQISGSGVDAGIWLYHNENSAHPVVVRQNSISGSASVGTNAGEGTGVFLTDDGAFFGDEDADSYATIAGNSITGFARGIDLYRHGSSPAGGRNVVATIGGAAPTDNNTLANNATAIRVYESDGAANGGRLAVASILGNNLSIVGNGTGVEVDGGAATLANNRITSNDTGVLVRNGGAAKLQSNDLRNNAIAGLRIETGGIVDAGQSGASSDYTGLGISSGGNDFSTYTPGVSQPRAIVNANSGSPYDQAGAQGSPYDVSAEGNLFWSAAPADIEGVVDHDHDNPLVGLVDYAVPTLGVLATGTVNEGASYTLNVGFTGATTNHKITIDWGDGVVDEIPVAPGVFAISPSHTYVDDNPTATSSDPYSIAVEVKETAGGDSDSDTTSVTVKNVAPTITGLAAAAVNEGQTSHLTGTIVDPGTADTFSVVVNWGDGSTPETFNGLSGAFDLTHLYADDNPTGTNGDDNTISVTITDDDTGTSSPSTTVHVANLAPVVAGGPDTKVDLGYSFIRSGSFSDLGTMDSFTATVDYGDGAGAQPLVLSGTSFSLSHNYASAGIRTVTVAVTDDDGAVGTDTIQVSVTNLAPTADIIDVTPDPRNTSVSTIQIVFSEPVTGFNLADLNLDRNLDGLGNLLGGGQTLTTSDNITYTLSGLSSITASGGSYNLHLAAATSGITDNVGNALTANANESWTSTAVDTIAPTADIVNVTPDPRGTSVSTITVVFSEPVVGVSLGDFSIDRNLDGKGNLIPLSWFSPTVTLSTSDNQTYTINGLASRTATAGVYTAYLTAAGSGIADLAGNPLVANAADQWTNNSTVDADPPIVDIIDVTPDPRTSSVNSIQITFFEPVTGFGLNDLNLDRNGDGLGNLLTGAQTLTTSDNITWTLGNLAALTSANGTYSLTLNHVGSGIIDGAGNALAISGYDKWTKVAAALSSSSASDVGSPPEVALAVALQAAADDELEETLDLIFS